MSSRLSVVALTCSAALALAACGSGGDAGGGDVAGKSPKDVIAAVADALEQADGMHISGTITDAEGPGRLDARVDAGGDVDATMDQGGQHFAFRLIGRDAYILGDAKFWESTAGDEVGAKLGGHWVKTSAFAGELKAIVEPLRPAGLASCLRDGATGTLSTRQATLDGERVIVLVDKGDRPGASPGELYVAATGKPLPLRVTQSGPARPGGVKVKSCGDDDTPDTTTKADYRLNGFEEHVKVSVPADAIDLGALHQGGADTGVAA